jgi:hypothetical protein
VNGVPAFQVEQLVLADEETADGRFLSGDIFTNGA